MESNEEKLAFVITLGRSRFQETQTVPQAVRGRHFLKQRVSFFCSIQCFMEMFCSYRLLFLFHPFSQIPCSGGVKPSILV